MLEVVRAADGKRRFQATARRRDRRSRTRHRRASRGRPPGPIRAAGPTYSSEAQSERSEKKYGTTSCGWSRPSMFSAAVLPWLNATSQCSIRMRCAAVHDALVLGDVAGGEDARARRSGGGSRPRRRRCSPISRPAVRASLTSGTAPTPTTTASASSRRPLLVTTRVTRPPAPSKLSSSSSPKTSIPCSSRRCWKNRPACSPKPRLERDRLEHHERAGAAELGQRGGHLAWRCRSRRSAPRFLPAASSRIASLLPSVRR